MDVIERVGRKGPVLRCVVDLEGQVWRTPDRLDHRDVCTDHLGVGVCICKITVLYDKDKAAMVGISGVSYNITYIAHNPICGWSARINTGGQ